MHILWMWVQKHTMAVYIYNIDQKKENVVINITKRIISFLLGISLKHLHFPVAFDTRFDL